MHQYRTIAQTLFVLSVLNNLVFAAPVVVPQDAHDTVDTGDNVIVDDVATVLERGAETELTQYPSSSPPPPPGPDGSPSHGSSPLDKSALAPSSVAARPPDLSAYIELYRKKMIAEGKAPMQDSTTVASKSSARPLSMAGGPAPVPGSNTGPSTSSRPGPSSATGVPDWGSKNSPYDPVTLDMVEKDKKFYQTLTAKRLGGAAFFATVITGFVLLSTLQGKHKDN